MGWLWSSTNDKSAEDPRKSLDPSLREFLDKESSAKREGPPPSVPSSPSSSQEPSLTANSAPSTQYRAQLNLDQPGVDVINQTSAPRENSKSIAPPESLFQDGRYAHLWENYRPQVEIEAAGRSDQDRMSEIVDAYHNREAKIGRAALENCVMEQMAEQECWQGGWRIALNMCRVENRAFNRCYTMQQRFLKALGYLSNGIRDEGEEERIQMHADKLFHQMLEREKAAKEAKELGQEEVKFEPLISPEETTKALGSDSAFARARRLAEQKGRHFNISSFPQDKQLEILQRVEGLSPVEKEIELQLIAAESRAHQEYADQIEERFEAERQQRADRREHGKETVGDTIKRLWGWK